MGYTTYFSGEFTLDKPLTQEHYDYLTAFNNTRRMRRDATKTLVRPDPVREAAKLPIGFEGAYFVGEDGFKGQGFQAEGDYEDVLDHNAPPGGNRMAFVDANGIVAGYDSDIPRKWGQVAGYDEELAQPGLWCQWRPNGNGTAIGWDEGEKFYDYIPWLGYLLRNFLIPWGYVLNGEIHWDGEESGDIGAIRLVDNQLSIGEHYEFTYKTYTL